MWNLVINTYLVNRTSQTLTINRPMHRDWCKPTRLQKKFPYFWKIYRQLNMNKNGEL